VGQEVTRALLLLAPALLDALTLEVEPFASQVRTIHLPGENVLSVARKISVEQKDTGIRWVKK
jgi:hypothetical protein